MDIANGITIDPIAGAWELPLAEFTYSQIAHDATGHDIYHCLRVKRLALRIGAVEQLDRDVLVATAYLHDIGRARERLGYGDHVAFGIAVAREQLQQLDFPQTKITGVLRCIEYHEEYAWARSKPADTGPFHREILAFQDADRLDAIGAVGVARMFMFGGAYQRPLWIPEVKPGSWKHGELGSSTYNHMHEKLLKLKETMNTPAGRALAEARHDFMQQFMVEFEREWFGDT